MYDCLDCAELCDYLVRVDMFRLLVVAVQVVFYHGVIVFLTYTYCRQSVVIIVLLFQTCIRSHQWIVGVFSNAREKKIHPRSDLVASFSPLSSSPLPLPLSHVMPRQILFGRHRDPLSGGYRSIPPLVMAMINTTATASTSRGIGCHKNRRQQTGVINKTQSSVPSPGSSADGKKYIPPRGSRN